MKVVEKPKNPTSNLAILGLYIFNNKEIFKAISKIKPSWINELEITDAIQEVLIEGYQIGYFMMEEHWLDVGTPEDLLYANKKQLTTITPRIEGGVDEKTIVKGNIIIEKGARVVNSVLEGKTYYSIKEGHIMKLIEGVKIKNLKYHCDERGRLTEILRKDEELLNGLGGRSRNGFM